MLKRLVMLSAAAALVSGAWATEVYKWTEEHGKVHASDRAPEQHQGRVQIEDSRAHELSARQQREAKARALDLTEKARRKTRRLPVRPLLPPAEVEDAGVETNADVSNETECQRLNRLYRESDACFAPYKLANGATRAEAFEHCTPVAEPSVACANAR